MLSLLKEELVEGSSHTRGVRNLCTLHLCPVKEKKNKTLKFDQKLNLRLVREDEEKKIIERETTTDLGFRMRPGKRMLIVFIDCFWAFLAFKTKQISIEPRPKYIPRAPIKAQWPQLKEPKLNMFTK